VGIGGGGGGRGRSKSTRCQSHKRRAGFYRYDSLNDAAFPLNCVHDLFVARTPQALKRNGRNLKLMLRCLEGLAECAAGLGNFKEAIDLERRRFELSR
jgi:hypothetical protein